MNWRVTYRAKDGKQAVEIVEAASRNDVFKAIAAKGISAIRVEEAVGKAKLNKKSSSNSKRSPVAIIVALFAIACAVGIAYFPMAKKGSSSGTKNFTQKKQGPSSVIREVVPQTNGVGKVAATSKPKDVVEDNIPAREKIVEMISVITNADGSVLERFRTADGKIRSRQSAPKPIFNNASDQLLATAISGAASGVSMPPMPMMNNAEEEFRKSLETQITINDDDSEGVKALKQNVIALREEMRQLLDQGNSFADVLRDHRDIVNHGVEMRKEATRMIKEFVDSGDNDAANECLDKVNEVLAGMGIQKVEMPLTDAERRELIRERHRSGN